MARCLFSPGVTRRGSAGWSTRSATPPRKPPLENVAREIGGRALLIARRIGGAGADPRQFGMRWFLPTIWRYRRPLGHVLAASLFVQIFALTTPLFFQVVVDKVLTHRG